MTIGELVLQAIKNGKIKGNEEELQDSFQIGLKEHMNSAVMNVQKQNEQKQREFDH